MSWGSGVQLPTPHFRRVLGSETLYVETPGELVDSIVGVVNSRVSTGGAGVLVFLVNISDTSFWEVHVWVDSASGEAVVASSGSIDAGVSGFRVFIEVMESSRDYLDYYLTALKIRNIEPYRGDTLDLNVLIAKALGVEVEEGEGKVSSASVVSEERVVEPVAAEKHIEKTNKYSSEAKTSIAASREGVEVEHGPEDLVICLSRLSAACGEGCIFSAENIESIIDSGLPLVLVGVSQGGDLDTVYVCIVPSADEEECSWRIVEIYGRSVASRCEKSRRALINLLKKLLKNGYKPLEFRAPAT